MESFDPVTPQGLSISNLFVLELTISGLLLTLVVFGMALAVSSLAVHFGDVRDLVANLLTLAFFLTPVLYPAASVPERYRGLLRANPFAVYFAALHDCLFFFRPIAAADWAATGAGARHRAIAPAATVRIEPLKRIVIWKPLS